MKAAVHELPFELTAAQKRAWSQISSDLARPHPMRRLLQGDVGSGKTVVAWLAADYGFEGWAAHTLVGMVGQYDVVTVAGSMALRIPREHLG